jgi:hypothetical protein
MVAEVIAVNRTRRLETSLPQVLAAAFFAAALAAWIVPVDADQVSTPFPPTVAKSYHAPGYVAPPASTSGKTTIFDMFSAMPDPNWGPDDAYSTVALAALSFHVPAKQQAMRFAAGYRDPEVDLLATVVPPEESKPGSAVGLVVQADGKGNAAALFLIDPVARRSAVYSEVGGKLIPLHTWSDAPALVKWIPTYPHVNRIEAIAGKNSAIFILNGVQVADISLPATPTGSLIGFYAAGSDSDEGDFAFSNVLAHFPRSEPPPPLGIAQAPTSASGPAAMPASGMPSNAEAAIQALTGTGQAVGGFANENPATDFNPGDVIFTDNFQTLDKDWNVDDPDAVVQGGRFVIKAAAGRQFRLPNLKYMLPQFDVAIDVAAAPDSATHASAGLVLWDTGDTYTFFQVAPGRSTFAIYNIAPGGDTPVADWGTDPAINIGPGATNHLEAIAGDKKVFFLINGHPVASMAPPSSSTLGFPNVGLIVLAADDGPAVFKFANLVVKMPPKVITNLVPAPPPAAPGQTIFSDKFSSLDPSWGHPDANVFAAGGQLRVTVPANQSDDPINGKYAYGPIDLSTDVTVLPSGDPAMGAGLAFWGSDDVDYTFFDVDPQNGQFFATRLDAGKTTNLIDAKVADAIDVTPGATNHIEVSLRADKAYLIVNGREVGELPAPQSSAGGLIGFDVENGGTADGTVAFSNLSVKAPSGSGPPAGMQPELADGQASFTDDFQNMDDGWGQPDAHVYTANGRMEVHSDAGKEADALESAHLVETGDVSASMVAEDDTQSGSSGGLLFWATDYQNYTLFSVDPQSSKFAVFQEVDGKSKTLIDWSSTSLLDTGPNKPNLIGVALRSDRATFLINGHQVDEIRPSGKPAGQAVGFDSYAGKNGPGNFGFAHLVVTPPEAGDLPPGTSAAPATAPGKTIFSDDFKTLDPSWGVANASIYAASGRLELRSAGNGGEVDAISNKFAYDAADIETTFVEEAGAAHGPLGGILFWASDAAHYTLFAVDPISGKFAAFDQIGDKSDTLLHWAASATISQGLNAPNRLRVSLTADKATMFINGQQVGVLDKPATVPGKLIGLYAGGDKQPGSFGFSGIAVKAPGGSISEAQATASPPPKSAGSVPAVSASSNATIAATGPAANEPVGAAPPTAPATEAASSPQDEASPPVALETSQHGTQSRSPGSAHGVTSSAPESPQNGASAAPQAPTAPGAPLASAGASAQSSAAPGAMCPGNVVFEDDFRKMDLAWGRGDKNTFVTPNHAFGLAAIADHLNGRFNESSRYADVDICVNAFVSIAADPTTMGGLLFWGDSDNDNYFLAITADGRFGVYHLRNSTVADKPIPLTTTSALKTGKSIPNAIEISLRGNQGTVIINGQTVGSFTGQPPTKGGYIGLQMAAATASAAAWGFYHLVVAAPASGPQAAVEQAASHAVAPSSSSPSAAPACGGRILYQDDFRTLDPSWGTTDQSFYVKNGALMVAAAAAMTTSRANDKARYGDFDVCVLAGSPLPPKTAGSAGLIFWATDAQNFYVLAVSNRGSYAVLRYAGGEVSAAVPWTSTPAIKTGAGVWNALEVSAVGNTASIAINGRALNTLQGTPPAGGSQVALVAAAPKGNATLWAFGRLRIAAPAAPPIAGDGQIRATAATVRAGSPSH